MMGDSPTQQTPLTDDEIDKLVAQVLRQQFEDREVVILKEIDRAICRAVEAWHKIGNTNAD
jgi:DNA-binding protein